LSSSSTYNEFHSYPAYEGTSKLKETTIQRQWNSYDPVTSVASPKVRCNGGTSAPQYATVAAGGTVTAKWKQWTHKQGSWTGMGKQSFG